MTRRLSGVLFAASLFFMYHESLSGQLARARDPFTFNDDVRQDIFPYYGINDYLAAYQLETRHLPGYRLLYSAAARWADPAGLSKVLPYLLWAALLAFVGAAAWPFGGLAAAWSAAALALSSDLFLSRMVGGGPRAFAFPLMALAAAAMIRGRPWVLAAAAVLAAATYPMVGVIALIALGLLLALPSGLAPMRAKKRLRLFFAASALCAFIVLPTLVKTRAHYGPTMRAADAADYPETGPGGRLGAEDLPSFDPLAAAEDAASRTLLGAGEPFIGRLDMRQARGHAAALCVILAAACLGIKNAAGSKPAAKRLLLLWAAALAASLAAVAGSPHLFLPQRYILYSLPILLVVSLPAAVSGLLSSPAAMTASTAVFLAFFGGRGDPSAGYTIRVTDHRGLYSFLSALPASKVVAGWPAGILDNVPYLSHRKVLLNYETHFVFHERYLLEMRRRLICVAEGYFAADVSQLRRLRDGCGVDYLIADRKHFGYDPPRYFTPFGGWFKARWEAAHRIGFEVPRQIPAAMIYEEGSVVVLDLSRI